MIPTGKVLVRMKVLKPIEGAEVGDEQLRFVPDFDEWKKGCHELWGDHVEVVQLQKLM